MLVFFGFLIIVIVGGIIALIWLHIKQSKQEAIRERIIQANRKKEDIYNEKFKVLYESVSIPNNYNIVNLKRNNFGKYNDSYKIWRKDNRLVFLLANEETVKNHASYIKEDEIKFEISIDDISLCEREDNQQVITKTYGGGSKYSLWTGTQKVSSVHTRTETVGSKGTLLFVASSPYDIQMVFNYSDYSVLNRLISNRSE